MTGNDALLTAARFDDKLKTYWYLQIVLICVASVVGIVILPIWLLGWGQWYVRRSFESLKCELNERTLVVKRLMALSMVHLNSTNARFPFAGLS